MHQDIKEIFVTEQEIVEITKRLGSEISADYENKQPILVGLLNGCVPFYAELIKNITVMMEFDFMDVKSYEGTQSVGEVKIKKDVTTSCKNWIWFKYCYLYCGNVATSICKSESINEYT